MATVIGSSAIVLSIDSNQYDAGMNKAGQTLDRFTNNGKAKLDDLNKAAGKPLDIDKAFKGIQSQLQSINFGQFFSKSLEKGVLDFQQLDWGGIGAGIGAMIGGPIGAAIGAALGGVFTAHFDTVKQLKKEFADMRGLALASGMDQAELAALQRSSGVDPNRLIGRFNIARNEALTGNEQMARSFERLSISPETAVTSVDQLIEAFSRLDRVEALQIARQLNLISMDHPAEGAPMIAFLRGGQTSIREQQVARNIGVPESEARLAHRRALDEQADAASTRGLFSRVGFELTNVANSFTSLLSGAGNGRNYLEIGGQRTRLLARAREFQERRRQEVELSRPNAHEAMVAGFSIQLDSQQEALDKRRRLLERELQLGRQLTDQEKLLFELRQHIPNALVSRVRLMEQEITAQRILEITSSSNQRTDTLRQEITLGRALTETEKAINSVRNISSEDRSGLERLSRVERMVSITRELQTQEANRGMLPNERPILDAESMLPRIDNEANVLAERVSRLQRTLNARVADGVEDSVTEGFRTTIREWQERITALRGEANDIANARSAFDTNIGRNFTEQANPTIALRRDVTRLQSLANSGAINSATATFQLNRMLSQAEQALHLGELKTPTAAIAGSREAVEAVLRYQAGAGEPNSPQQRMARILEEQNRINRDGNNINATGFEALARAIREDTGGRI